MLRTAPLRRALAALALMIATSATLTVASPATAAENQIADGQLTWGVKESWRRYIGIGSMTGDGAQVTGWIGSGDTAYPEAFTFPVLTGTFDDATDTTGLRLGGWVHFQSWCGLIEPGKCALDTRFSDLEIEIGPEAQVLRGTHVGYERTDPGGQLHTDTGVVLAKFDVTGASTDFSGGDSRWDAIPTVAGAGFNLYLESTLLDDASLHYTGPGGLPDLSERWDTPGAPGLRSGPVWLADAASRARAVHPSSAHELVHTVDLVDAGTADANLVLAARDAETLEPVGTPYTWAFAGVTVSDFQMLRTAFDPATDSVFFVTYQDGSGHDEATVRRASWDAGTQSYAVEALGSLGQFSNAFNAVEGIAWNSIRGELAAIAYSAGGSDDYETDALHRFVPDAGGWRHEQTRLRLPDDGVWAGATSVDSPLHALAFEPPDAMPVAVARDGSYVVAPSTGRTFDGSGEHPYPALHVSVASDGSATVAAIAGTTTPRTVFGTYYGFASLTRDLDGSLLLHNSSQVMDAYVRIDVAGGTASAGPIVDAPADAFPPFELSGFANSMVADPAIGLVWATDTFSSEGFRLNALDGDELVGRFTYDDFPAAGGDGAFGRLAVGPDSAVYLPIDDADSGRLGYRRLAYTGTVPSVASQPHDRAVTLGVGETSEDVAFTVAIADADDAIQWQAKAAGESRFSDVPGANATTLTVAARATSDGTDYRARASNAAGRVVSDAATLAVAHAPALVSDVPDRTVTEGADALFLVSADANPEPTVTWQRRVGGFWQSINPADDNFVVNGPSLTVLDTNTEQSGSRFRAKLLNSVAAVYSRTATLTVTARASIPPQGLDGVTLEWTGNDEMQRNAPAGGANYFSAGASDGTEATYSAATGDVRIVHVAAGGAESPETWATRGAHVRDGGHQLVRLLGGRASAGAGGTTTIAWDGDFSVNFYGGLVPFTVSDPRLALDAAGNGTLRADLSGYASSQADPTRRAPLAPVADVTIATFAGVELDPAGRRSVTPDWEGVEVALPVGLTAQNRAVAGWGAWPQPFVDFHVGTGLASYWYTSGSAFDAFKRPHAFVADFSGARPHVDPPVVEERSAPRPAVVRGRIAVSRGPRALDRRRRATLATLVCPPAARCTVTAPRRVTVRIAGKRHTAAVLAPRWLRAGARGVLRVRLTKVAAARLRGHRAKVSVRVTIATQGVRTTRTVLVTIKAQ